MLEMRLQPISRGKESAKMQKKAFAYFPCPGSSLQDGSGEVPPDGTERDSQWGTQLHRLPPHQAPKHMLEVNLLSFPSQPPPLNRRTQSRKSSFTTREKRCKGKKTHFSGD